jgi:hypothetical protein
MTSMSVTVCRNAPRTARVTSAGRDRVGMTTLTTGVEDIPMWIWGQGGHQVKSTWPMVVHRESSKGLTGRAPATLDDVLRDLLASDLIEP